MYTCIGDAQIFLFVRMLFIYLFIIIKPDHCLIKAARQGSETRQQDKAARQGSKTNGKEESCETL